MKLRDRLTDLNRCAAWGHAGCLHRILTNTSIGSEEACLPTYSLTPWSRVLLEKLTVLCQARNSLHFMEPVGSLPHSQVPATCPYPEPARSSPYSNIPLFHFNIILASMSGSPKWSLSLRFPHQNSVYASPLTHTRYIPLPSNSSWFYYPKNIGWVVQIINPLKPNDPYRSRTAPLTSIKLHFIYLFNKFRYWIF